ncbi:ArsA family ATPase [Ornithinimicrobium sp. W1665]|uniref:ArsA family ATPase n=1 Tax=Ornithinimicrobium sp. W1665 TaxID=3416666 RepID=UPI003D6BA423
MIGVVPRYGEQPGDRGGDRRSRRDAEIRRVLDRRQDRFRTLRELLQDPARSGFVIVLAAERLPVLETIELHEQLSRSHMDVAALVVNKRSPADAGELLAARRAVEDGYLAQLTDELPDLPVVEVPLLPGEVLGEEGLSELARCWRAYGLRCGSSVGCRSVGPRAVDRCPGGGHDRLRERAGPDGRGLPGVRSLGLQSIGALEGATIGCVDPGSPDGRGGVADELTTAGAASGLWTSHNRRSSMRPP